MAIPRCGMDEPEEGGPITNPEVIPDPGPSEHSKVERIKNKETKQVRALATLITKARVLELYPELTGMALRDRQQVMKGDVLRVGYAQRKARYQGPDEPEEGCRPCGSGPENTNRPEFALVTYWPAHKPVWYNDKWVPEGFWS